MGLVVGAWVPPHLAELPAKLHAARLALLVCVQTFIKVVNYQHMMPTRYTLEVRRQCASSSGPNCTVQPVGAGQP